MAATLVSNISINKTELYSRKNIFENGYGIKLTESISTLDIVLDTFYEIGVVSNFLLISTDSIIDLVLNQVTSLINPNGTTSFVSNVVTIPISGIFLSYANFGKVLIKRNTSISRLPKVSIIYS